MDLQEQMDALVKEHGSEHAIQALASALATAELQGTEARRAQRVITLADELANEPLIGITWSNDEESVCQTGYFTDDLDEAKRVAIAGLKMGNKLSDCETFEGQQIDGMNDSDAPQHIKYAILQTENDDLETVTL